MSKKHVTMKQLPESEMPYEKCFLHGAERLSDAELLSVIIRTGSQKSRAIDVAMSLLDRHSDYKGLLGLNYLSLKELMSIQGIGKIKAIQILCILELSKRMAKASKPKRLRIYSPEDIADFFMQDMRFLTEEHMVLLLLDGANHIITHKTLSIGSVNHSILSSREVMRAALFHDAVKIVLIHNHPSGDPTPSVDDIHVTKTIQSAGEILHIVLLDHIIIGDNQFVSLKRRELF